MALFIPLAILASAQALPPPTALPPPQTDAAAVLAPINSLFAAFEAGDAAAMLRQVHPDGRVTATGTRSSGSGLRQQSWTQFAERLKPQFPGLSRVVVSRPSIGERCAMEVA